MIVLCLISRAGITGYSATLVSTMAKMVAQRTLAAMSIKIRGCDHENSSVDGRDRLRSKDPTLRTNVKDPPKSMRPSLVLGDKV